MDIIIFPNHAAEDVLKSEVSVKDELTLEDGQNWLVYESDTSGERCYVTKTEAGFIAQSRMPGKGGD